MQRRSHLSDDRLVEVCLSGTPTTAEEAHFTRCGDCEARRSQLERLLREVDDHASAASDAAFPEDRLAAQRTRILHRIEQDGRPARVITFPAAQSGERPLRTRPAGRWIAAAAAAGLAVGLLAGHLAHDLEAPPARSPVMRTAATRPRSQPTMRAVNASLNDEQLLGEIDAALDGPRLAILRPLNDLTPR